MDPAVVRLITTEQSHISTVLAEMSPYFARHQKVVSVVSKANYHQYKSEPQIGLPTGWMYKDDYRRDGKKDRSYLSPHGHGLRSKTAMMEYRKIFPDLVKSEDQDICD